MACCGKDDDTFVDEIIQKVHDDMIAFDSGLSEMVISLMVRRPHGGGGRVSTLLDDVAEI